MESTVNTYLDADDAFFGSLDNSISGTESYCQYSLNQMVCVLIYYPRFVFCLWHIVSVMRTAKTVHLRSLPSLICS